MRKIIVFNLVSLDGYYAGSDGDISWHNTDEEFGTFAIEQTKTFTVHMYGRITYEMMAGFWPTKHSRETDPVVARLMNTTPKIVFSKTLKDVRDSGYWKNTTLYHSLTPEIIRKIKRDGSGLIAVLGSGTIVKTLTEWGLVDEYRLLVNPLVLGKGKSMFAGVKNGMKLTLVNTRVFGNGNVLLTYTPKR